MHPAGNIGVLATLIGLLLVVGVGINAGQPARADPQPITSIGLALATGGLGDRAFNDGAYAGLQRAQRAFNTRFRVVEWKGRAAQVENLRDLAQERHDLIIAVGQENAQALGAVAAEYPSLRFAIVDAEVNAPNVTSVVFRELEGDFLAGALAALLSPGGTVGFLGGADIPIIRRIEHGWTQGVRYVNPDARILVEYAGGKDDFSGFNKPDVGAELTTRMYRQQAEVVYTPAGRTALGAIEAAKRQQRLVITTGNDQRWIAPDVVVASRTKNMDTAIFRLLTELQANELEPGTRELDLRLGGVGLTPLDSRLVPADVREQLAAIKRDLDAGKIEVQEYSEQ